MIQFPSNFDQSLDIKSFAWLNELSHDFYKEVRVLFDNVIQEKKTQLFFMAFFLFPTEENKAGFCLAL